VKIYLAEGETLVVECGDKIAVEVTRLPGEVRGFLQIPTPARGEQTYLRRHFGANVAAINSPPLAPVCCPDGTACTEKPNCIRPVNLRPSHGGGKA
jgi:hypothetical protein